MSNQFIIGASGYIGKQLYEKAARGSGVIGTTSSGSDQFIQLQLSEPEKFDYETIQPSDVVFLSAAISAPDICANDHEYAWRVNVTGTSGFISKVIERGGRVIFFSSDTVYGERKDEFDERAICNPVGEYAIMKHEVESKFLGNPAFKAVRLSYVFSKEDKFTQYLSSCAENENEAEIFHPFYRAIIHREDVVQAVIALANRWEEYPQEIINFGGPDVVSRVEFAQKIKSIGLAALKVKQVEPDSEFFTNRPRVIQMSSPLLESLLERSPHSLSKAIKIEFNIEEKD